MKKLIEKYIATQVLKSIGLITLMITGLEIFMLFVAERGAIGQGHYTVLHALFYVLLQTPYQLYLFFPIACLLGVLLGLGLMANHRELLVIRASGMSIWQVVSAVLKVAFVLVFFVCLLAETVVPKLVRYSEDLKNNYKSAGQSLRTPKGLWLRTGNNFLYVGHALSKHRLEDVYQYQFNNKHQLVLSRKIDKAVYQEGKWRLYGIKETHLSAKRTKVKTYQERLWDINVAPQMIAVSDKEPDEMNLMALFTYIKLQKAAHLAVETFEMSFWRRLFQPITTSVMMLLAIPFIFGQLRSVTMGQRFLVGCTIGFSFHLLNEFSLPISQIYQVPPLLAASMPTLVFAAVGFLLMAKKR